MSKQFKFQVNLNPADVVIYLRHLSEDSKNGLLQSERDAIRAAANSIAADLLVAGMGKHEESP